MPIFQSLIKKEILHLLRDFRTVTVVLVIPVVLLLLFGFAISTEVNQVRVVAVVEQYTEETKQIIDQFRANSYTSHSKALFPRMTWKACCGKGGQTPPSCSDGKTAG